MSFYLQLLARCLDLVSGHGRRRIASSVADKVGNGGDVGVN
jgi:hypothetical protein